MLALSIELCDSLSLSLEGSYVLLSGSLMLIPWILFEYQFLQVTFLQIPLIHHFRFSCLSI